MTYFGAEGPGTALVAGLNGGPALYAAAPPAPPVEALRQQAAALLQRCYRWLEATVPAVPQVAGLVPALVTAVSQYEAQQYEACLAQTAGVIFTARQFQLAVPHLPPL